MGVGTGAAINALLEEIAARQVRCAAASWGVWRVPAAGARRPSVAPASSVQTVRHVWNPQSAGPVPPHPPNRACCAPVHLKGAGKLRGLRCVPASDVAASEAAFHGVPLTTLVVGAC